MVETIKFSEMNPGGDLAPGDETPGLLTGANVLFENPWTFLAPGTTAERPSPSAIMVNRLRYNTTLLAYEYYDGTEWVQIAETDGVLTATGTENQVLVNGTFGIPQDGAILLTLPQDIATGSSPTFQSLILSSATSFSLLAGGINATSALQSLTPGTAGQLLQSNGAAAIPSWTTATFPSGSGTLNHLLRSDGTNWVQTTATTLTSVDVLSGLTQLNVDNLRLDGNTFSSTNANGIITYSPNGSGYNAFTKDITLETAANPSITIYSDDLLGSSYLTLVDFDLHNSSIIKAASSGAALLTISPNPADGVSDSRMKMFRSTNTSSLESGLEIFTGDGTSTQQTYFRLNSDSFLNAVAGGVMIGSINAPTSKLDVRSDSSGATASTISLVNSIASGINSGVSLNFQPNANNTRAASIRSIQTTAGNFADLEFFTCGATTPLLAMTISTAQIVSLVYPLPLSSGGSNASLTASNGGIVYSTASAMAILSGTATAGQFLQSGASGAPSWTTATFPATSGTSGTILRSNGTNWVNSTSTFSDTYTASNLLYSNGSNTVTGLATANSAVLVTNSSGVPAWSGTMTNGQLIIGSTTATPTAATLTAGSGISITNGAGSITIASTTSGMTWTTVSGTTQSAAVNNGYVTNNAGAVTVTLPTTFALGEAIEVKGLGAGGWILAAGTARTIRYGTSVTSSGGSLTSANQYDTVKVTGLVANTTWSVDYALSTGLTVA